jgi:hypothetical protein
MQTKTYAELISLIEGLCGVAFVSVELPRIKSLVNRRARKAYNASNLWQRFLKVGEQRVVTSNVIPFDETNLDSIDTFIRIHKQSPYQSSSVQEYDFYITAAGATIVAGTLNPSSAFVTYKKQFADTYGDGNGETTAIPLEWFQYLAHGVYSDFLRAEGQQEKSALADQEADLILQEELLHIDEQFTTNMVGTRIRTNSSMQLR